MMDETVSSASMLVAAAIAINRRMHRAAHDEMTSHSPYQDLRVFDYIVLRIVGHRPGITIRQLSEHLGLAHSTVSSMLQRYDRLGLIAKNPCDQDKRSVSLSVTDAWHAVRDTLSPSLEAANAELIGRLTDHEQAVLREGLSALLRVLQEDSTSTTPLENATDEREAGETE